METLFNFHELESATLNFLNIGNWNLSNRKHLIPINWIYKYLLCNRMCVLFPFSAPMFLYLCFIPCLPCLSFSLFPQPLVCLSLLSSLALWVPRALPRLCVSLSLSLAPLVMSVFCPPCVFPCSSTYAPSCLPSLSCVSCLHVPRPIVTVYISLFLFYFVNLAFHVQCV